MCEKKRCQDEFVDRANNRRLFRVCSIVSVLKNKRGPTRTAAVIIKRNVLVDVVEAVDVLLGGNGGLDDGRLGLELGVSLAVQRGGQ